MNRMPKYIASTRLERSDWNNSTVLKGDAMAAVAKLKQESRGEILVVGSRALVNALKEHNLIDEYRLMVFPVVLGSGMRLFDDAAEATTLGLIESRSFDNGVVVLPYRPAGRSDA